MPGRECYHCKQWVEEGEEHDCWTTTEAALTQGLSDDLRDAWERLRETASSFGDQRIYASHKSIMFSRKSCYFFVRPKKNFLEVCVFLARTLRAPQVRRSDRASKSKVYHIIHIRHRDEVEAPITDWLEEAYEMSGVLMSNPDKIRSKPEGKRETKWILNKGDVTQSMSTVDFGTYHHSTPSESKRIREYSEEAFSKILRSLYPSGAALTVLDAGCGLGFLTYVAAKLFPKAKVTGIDLFSHASVSKLSIENATENMKALRLDSRTSFLKHDLTRALNSKLRYDLAVSNLVFHNMGKKRFEAYGNVFDVLKPEAYFVLADWFPHEKSDTDYLRKRSVLVDEITASALDVPNYKIKVLRRK